MLHQNLHNLDDLRGCYPRLVPPGAESPALRHRIELDRILRDERRQRKSAELQGSGILARLRLAIGRV